MKTSRAMTECDAGNRNAGLGKLLNRASPERLE